MRRFERRKRSSTPKLPGNAALMRSRDLWPAWRPKLPRQRRAHGFAGSLARVAAQTSRATPRSRVRGMFGPRGGPNFPGNAALTGPRDVWPAWRPTFSGNAALMGSRDVWPAWRPNLANCFGGPPAPNTDGAVDATGPSTSTLIRVGRPHATTNSDASFSSRGRTAGSGCHRTCSASVRGSVAPTSNAQTRTTRSSGSTTQYSGMPKSA